MRRIVAFALVSLLVAQSAAFAYQDPDAPPMTNEDVVKLVKAKVSPEEIITKIESSRCHFDTSPSVLAELRYKGIPNSVLMAMVRAPYGQPETTAPKRQQKVEPRRTERAAELAEPQPAPRADSTRRVRIKDELTESFKRLSPTVVTVWSEYARGTGFIIDKEGLILTNQHVVGPAEYVAVQYDASRKVPARVLASDAERDVAVLWANFEAIPEAEAAPIAPEDEEEPPVVEGERVLTIGSPLHQRKVMTTGIVSRVEQKAIISDINLNKGNSGGPLFNSLGEVVGITTFLDPVLYGPGLSGIVRIEQAAGLITQARRKMAVTRKPDARLLPVDPTEAFPLAALKSVATAEDFDMPRYSFGVGEFDVLMMTPILSYRIATEAEREALKTKNKRTDKDTAVRGTFRPFDNLREWGEYVGEFRPVLTIQATPESGESFWGMFGRSLALSQGIFVRPTVRFKTDFYRMRLMCGDSEVEPIHPGKVALLLSANNRFIRAQDATYMGLYTYPADAISSDCGQVRLEVFSERNPEKARVKTLSEKTVSRIEADFAPYFRAHGRPARQVSTKTRSQSEQRARPETGRTRMSNDN